MDRGKEREMKIGILSDLHLEFGGPSNLPENDADVIVIAGDIHPDVIKRGRYIDKIEQAHGVPVFYILGNHDHYYSDFPDPADTIKSRQIEGVKFSGATLWTDMTNPLNWNAFLSGMNDAVCIKNYTEHDFINTHMIHKKYLMESGADVIVSHHAPSYLSVGSRFEGDNLNCCFCTEMFDEVLDMKKPTKLWIHGHIHERKDYMIGETRVICNPWGYPREIDKKDRGLMVVEI
jgi:Icc-related predicted phosphoesterase